MNPSIWSSFDYTYKTRDLHLVIVNVFSIRAKLADWLASKGKTLKRPPIPETSQKPAMKTQTGPKPTTRAQPNLESAKETLAANSKNPKDVKDPENQPMSPAGSTNIMNITLDLLDDEEEEDPPADTEITLESLVLNLCDKLDAMETPSSCEDGGRLLTVNGVEMQVGEHEADKGFEIIDEEELLDENTSDEAETVCIKNNDHEVPEKKLFDGEDDGDDTDTSPEMESASIVKYNVKTTPYLQSVKKRIECEMAPESGSRRKSMIKDLKFLTPVRRSTRIQRTSSRLPGMLNDHDTCISSLAELVKLEGADASAYIYRKNSALLEDLPDQSVDLAKVCL
ncbi:hypothetical protein DNTS_025403 [Danionella cerebrum]|uniref:Cytoskeleton-associated protein 2 C-terminal domain-containing protein n=1 Tax=Danionella cerebrum TaxID=2873325 RepID=A0A553QH30_9TELE|nr:hypothetical protein DNTS_025403 [Danionella translucida]